MTPTSTIASSPVLKTYKRPVNFGDVVLKALVERMDPEARTVAPQWRSLASSLGVSTMTLGRYIQRLKEDGRIETVEESRECRNSGDANLLCSLGAATNGHPSPTWLPNSRKRYFIKESVDADWAASVEPQFEREHVSKAKRRYKSTKAEMDAVADAHLAERCRLVMEDFVSRMDAATHMVAPKIKDMAARIGRRLTFAEYSRVVRTFKAAGLVEARRVHDASGDHSCDYVFVLNTEAIAGLDYLNLAKTYRLKTAHADGGAKRGATARNELGERILGYLRERMASDIHLVKAGQVEIGKVLGYAPCSVSAAIRKLIAEKRLVKVVGKARRGMGNDATVYRVIVDEHDLEPLPDHPQLAKRQNAGGPRSVAAATTPPSGGPSSVSSTTPLSGGPSAVSAARKALEAANPAPTPPRPRSVQKPAEIFTCLSLENFKNSGRREIRFDRISTVAGKSGADRTQIFDAMRVLHGIAQGKDVSAFPALWFGTDWPTTLSISLNTLRHGRLTYSVTLQRIDDNRVRVADERLAGRFETMLIRRKHFYTHLATKDRNGIGTTSFALCDAANILDADDPIVQFKRQLVELWLLNPDPNAMKSEIGFGVVNADVCGFIDFVTCMVMQQKREAFAAAMRDAVLRLCPDLVGYTVEKNAKGGPYLAVRHRSDLDPKGTPFALLDSAEKILFLVAFVCAMNGHSASAPVVWLSPFNWLGERERLAADRLVRTAFANRGQMIMLV